MITKASFKGRGGFIVIFFICKNQIYTSAVPFENVFHII